MAALLLLGPVPAGGEAVAASLRLGSPFGEGMVLQADKPVRVWGLDEPGTAVAVELAGAEASATAAGDGRWSVELPAMTEPGPHELAVRGSSEVVLGDVLVGEVWYCSGQSNMAWRLKQSDAGPEVMQAPADERLRFLRLPNRAAEEPEPFIGGAWEVSSPQTRPEMSAVAYFFGEKLREELDRPVGLIVGAWGGSKIEAWLPGPVFEASEHAGILRRIRKNNERRRGAAMAEWEAGGREGEKPGWAGAGPQHAPTLLHNGITHALEPLSIAGVLWYQGESNAWQPELYPDLFADLVASYREGFGDPELPVNFVQLPGFTPKTSWAKFRQAQRASAAADPRVGMAVTIDVGDPDDIHPRNKRPVGERLARLALANTYGREDVIAGSPRPTSVRLDPEDSRRVLVTFDRVGGGLEARPAGEQIRGVKLVDTRTSTYAHAEVEIVSPDTIALTSDAVADPNQVRHANANDPPVHLFNSEGLPVEPFVVEVQGAPRDTAARAEEPDAAANGGGVRFPGLTERRGSALHGSGSGTLVSGGVTLTLEAASGEFVVTGGGTGIEAPGERGSPGKPEFQVNDDESFTLRFDTDGTLEALVLGHFPGTSRITLVNGNEEVTVESSNQGKFDPAVEAAVGPGFSAGDVIEVNSRSDGTARTQGQTFRLADVVIEADAAGEPAASR